MFHSPASVSPASAVSSGSSSLQSSILTLPLPDFLDLFAGVSSCCSTSSSVPSSLTFLFRPILLAFAGVGSGVAASTLYLLFALCTKVRKLAGLPLPPKSFAAAVQST